MDSNLTNSYIEHLQKISRLGFSDAIIARAKDCLLDYLGVAIAGAFLTKPTTKSLIQHLHAQNGQVPVPGTEFKTDMLTAALLTGIHAHHLELDDGHRYGMMHPGATVISALLPWVAANKRSGKELLTGIIMGYEAAITLAASLQPTMKDKGYHATGTCGTIGAAMGIAFASDYIEAEMKNTLAAACTGASGLLEVIRDNSEMKPYNAGQAAVNGLMAAVMGKSGLLGPNDVLGGTHGFMHVMGNGDIKDFSQDDKFAIESIYVKPYAACRHAHSPIEAILNIRSKNQIVLNEIDEIIVHTYRWAVHLHDHTEISGITSAKMSTPYSVAVALITGKAGMDEFSEKYISNPDILDLNRKVKVVEDAELTKLVPGKRAARAEVKMHNGRIFSDQVDLPKGEPENPLTQQELADKFIALAMFAGKTKSECEEISDIVMNLEERYDELFKYL
jgi:2-methylcitrate dehydratase PrpD